MPYWCAPPEVLRGSHYQEWNGSALRFQYPYIWYKYSGVSPLLAGCCEPGRDEMVAFFVSITNQWRYHQNRACSGCAKAHNTAEIQSYKIHEEGESQAEIRQWTKKKQMRRRTTSEAQINGIIWRWRKISIGHRWVNASTKKDKTPSCPPPHQCTQNMHHLI